MVLRSCLCYKKCHASSSQQQKRSISLYNKLHQQSALTQQQQHQQHLKNVLNHKHISLQHKYPGLLLHHPRQQQRLFTFSVNSIGKQLEKTDLQPPTHHVTTPSSQKEISIEIRQKDLNHLLNDGFNRKQAKTFYRRLSKTSTANDLYHLLSPKLDSIEYYQLRSILKDAASYWSVETIHAVMSLCDDRYINWRLDLLDVLLSSYILDKNMNHLIGALPITTASISRQDVLPFYNAVLNKCLKQKEYDHVRQVLDLMKERGIDPDAASFNILIRMKLSTQNNTTLQPEQSFYIYKDMIAQGVKPNRATFNTFIKYACQNHQWNSLKIWLDMMEEDSIEPNPVTARILFRSYVTHPNSTELNEAFARVSSAVPILEKERFLNTGVAALLKAKQTKAAMDILDKTFALNEPLSVYSYNLLLQALCLEGKLESAQQVLDSMILPAEEKKKGIPNPDIVSFTTVINGLVRNSQRVKLSQLDTLYQQLMDQGLRTNNVLESVILYGLVKSEHTNKLTRAKSMFESILANKDRVNLPRQHADTSLAEMNIYNIMMDFYFLHYHQSKTLRHQIPQEPFALLEDAVERKKLKPTVSTLNILVRGLAILNKDLNAAEKMVTLLKDKGVSMDEKTVWYLTKSAYSQGQMSRARKWIETYESLDKSIQGSGLNYLKSILTKWEKKEDEEKVLD